jgi:hypothetical protein
MRGSLRNVVGLTRPYALPLPALFWAQIPDLRSMASLVISLFERLAHFRQLVSTKVTLQKVVYTEMRVKIMTSWGASISALIGSCFPCYALIGRVTSQGADRAAMYSTFCGVSLSQHHLYTARDSRLNRLQAFYSTVTHPSTNHARHICSIVRNFS